MGIVIFISESVYGVYFVSWVQNLNRALLSGYFETYNKNNSFTDKEKPLKILETRIEIDCK